MKKLIPSIVAVMCVVGFSALSFADEMGNMKSEMKGETGKMKKEMGSEKDKAKGKTEDFTGKGDEMK